MCFEFQECGVWEHRQFGEGDGLQLPSGRLVVCGWTGWYKTDFDSAVACLLSDTHGESWRVGAVLPHPHGPKGSFMQANEVGMAMLSNGSILLNARSVNYPRRILMRSDDGGETLVGEHYTEDLQDVGCSGSMVSLADGTLVFSAPDPATKSQCDSGRCNLQARNAAFSATSSCQRSNAGRAGGTGPSTPPRTAARAGSSRESFIRARRATRC